MRSKMDSLKLNRRSLLKTAALAGVAQIASPFVMTARAADTVKIGLDNPLTGTFAALGKNELIGAQLAVEQMNAKGGILGRQVELLVEDSTSGEAAVAVQKANKLIERDQVNFLLGNINSALAQAMANVSFEKKVFHIVPGGHTDSVTGTQCHWNVFRVCNTTRMETNSVSKKLLEYGKKWYFITSDYAFGRTLQQGFEASLKAANGTELGADYTPLGTTDFSANLIKAQSTNPDAIILLLAGDDMVNCLKQAVQFGLDKKTHIAGAQQELEVLLSLPPEALIGDWVFEWYWNQPNVPHVAEFVADIRKKSGGHVPTARTWFGYAATMSCKLAAEKAKSLDAVKMAQAMQGLVLPPEVALMPNNPFYREGDNQLMPTLFVGNSQKPPAGGDKEDLFHVNQLVKGVDAALPVAETGCKVVWPS
ncbi:MAG: ABC transporter substrate-binding protein [Xanthobacteraceae bacterium]|nr:ABC transporter substrate-binding protein [Xanthobacteraceae bacterium]